MQRPYVALELSPDLMALVESGEKRRTVRLGTRNYQADDKLFLINTETKLATEGVVTKAGWATLGRLEDAEDNELGLTYAALGYADAEDMVAKMSTFYPDISVESAITVVDFDLVL